MAIKSDKGERWNPAELYLKEHFVIVVNFSNKSSNMTNAMILTSTLSIVHSFPATYHLAFVIVCTFHGSLGMHDAAHTMRISDITTSDQLLSQGYRALRLEKSFKIVSQNSPNFA